VNLATDELVTFVVDADMGVADFPEPALRTPPVGADDLRWFDALKNNPLQ
jgi:hypothetical protein